MGFNTCQAESSSSSDESERRVASVCEWKANIPPFSIPFTAASEIVLSTDLTVSVAASTADLRASGEVEKKRVRARGRALVGRVRKEFIVDVDKLLRLPLLSGKVD